MLKLLVLLYTLVRDEIPTENYICFLNENTCRVCVLLVRVVHVRGSTYAYFEQIFAKIGISIKRFSSIQLETEGRRVFV